MAKAREVPFVDQICWQTYLDHCLSNAGRDEVAGLEVACVAHLRVTRAVIDDDSAGVCLRRCSGDHAFQVYLSASRLQRICFF